MLYYLYEMIKSIFRHSSTFFIFTLLLFAGCQETLHVADFTPNREIEQPSFEGYLNDPRFIRFEDPKTGLCGIQNQNGHILIHPKFYVLTNFNQWNIADAIVSKEEPCKWVKIDTKGKILAQSYFFDNGPDYFYQGLARFVKDNGKIGFINHKAQTVIPAEYDHANGFRFYEPITLVAKGGKDVCFDPPNSCCHHNHKIIGAKWGVIDINGKILIPLEFDDYQLEANDGNKYSLIFLKDGQSFRVYKNDSGNYLTKPYSTQ